MNGRDKIILAGATVLLVGLGTAATFLQGDSEAVEAPRAVEPVVAKEYIDPSQPIPSGTQRLMDKAIPVNEIPQELKEAENYLESRWGHMGDAGLLAPGIMPEGDQYFQEKRLLSGVRGNGKPIFAKAFIRPEKFSGPGVKPGATQGVQMPFRASSSELTASQTIRNVQRFADKGGQLSKKGAKNNPTKLSPTSNSPGSGYKPRSEAGKDTEGGGTPGSGGKAGG
ncbi:MAG: hypothetical protein ACI8TQ_000463 [Planctomycetota bacterium]|jgi:hypothetical protein